MLGFAADNASVMMGSMGGLKAKLLEKVPHLFCDRMYLSLFKFMFICCMSETPQIGRGTVQRHSWIHKQQP